MRVDGCVLVVLCGLLANGLCKVYWLLLDDWCVLFVACVLVSLRCVLLVVCCVFVVFAMCCYVSVVVVFVDWW